MEETTRSGASRQDRVRASGCNSLPPAATAIGVRVREGGVLATDGPFAETKEQVGGNAAFDDADRGGAPEPAGRATR